VGEVMVTRFSAAECYDHFSVSYQLPGIAVRGRAERGSATRAKNDSSLKRLASVSTAAVPRDSLRVMLLSAFPLAPARVWRVERCCAMNDLLVLLRVCLPLQRRVPPHATGAFPCGAAPAAAGIDACRQFPAR